ncbi:MAG: hypothetical protein AAGA65_29895 [Actinomycetota bacterium]
MTHTTYRLRGCPRLFANLAEAMTVAARLDLMWVHRLDNGESVVSWQRTHDGWAVIYHHRWQPGEFTGWWTAEPLNQDDPSNHAVDDCGCGDWEDGHWDPRCAAQTNWRLALVRDEGAHGTSFVRWLTTTEIRTLGLARETP